MFRDTVDINSRAWGALMRIDIILDGEFDMAAATDLRVLSDYLRQSDIPVSLTLINVPAIKDPLAIGVAALGVAVSTVGSIIGALSLWVSQRPKYSITVQRGDYTCTFSNLNKSQTLEIIQKLEAAEAIQPLLVRLVKSDRQ
jgi:hypothetical protein